MIKVRHLKKNKCSDVDMPQRKCLQQVRIESKIAPPRLIKLNKRFILSAVSMLNTHRAPELSFKFRKDFVATFSDDVITTRPREKFLSCS